MAAGRPGGGAFSVGPAGLSERLHGAGWRRKVALPRHARNHSPTRSAPDPSAEYQHLCTNTVPKNQSQRSTGFSFTPAEIIQQLDLLRRLTAGKPPTTFGKDDPILRGENDKRRAEKAADRVQVSGFGFRRVFNPRDIEVLESLVSDVFKTFSDLRNFTKGQGTWELCLRC